MKSVQADATHEIDLTELIAAIRAGDQQAFTTLYEMTSQEVYRTARAVLRDEEEALDVQQDTFVFAYNHMDQLSDPKKVRPWLRTIAVNRAKSILRRNSPVLFTELENEEGEGLPEQADLSTEASPELSLEQKETSELVSEILGELSDGQRAAVAMYYYEQMSIGEISEALGVAPGTVKSQLARGKKKIEEAVRALEKKGIKLYGLSPIPFLLELLKRQTSAVQQGELVLAKTLAEAGIASGAKAAAVSVAETVVLHATKPFFSTLVGKLVLGVICVGAVGGGIVGYRLAKDKLSPKVTPILYLDSSESPDQDPTAPTLPVELEAFAPETTAPAATEAVPDDVCGENLTWSFDPSEASLTITGSGDMTDYPDAQSVPWYQYRNEIQKFYFPEGLTGIGDYAFAGCVHLDYATMWTEDGFGMAIEHVTRIGNHAFAGCTGLSFISLGQELTSIGDSAFAGCTALSSFAFPCNVSLGKDAFRGAGLRSLRFSDDFTTIGSETFSQCGLLNGVVFSENISSVADSAFTGCAALREIWIMNRDCEFDKNALRGAPSDLMVCGFPGSTAEQYARENGYSFNPIVDNRDAIVEMLKQDSGYSVEIEGETRYYNPTLHYNGTVSVGEQYVSQIQRSEHVTVTEEEFQRAKQSGTIEVRGIKYEFTDSEEQTKQWNEYSENWDDDGAAAWMRDIDRGEIYLVLPEGDGYAFRAVWFYNSDGYLSDYTQIGWLLLDANSPASRNGTDCNLSGFYLSAGNPGSGEYVQQLMLNGDGELALLWASAGKK